ncbi:hypothetical protein CARUB_v10026018mg [Capsella rubella]|uniref:Uncharacterized protein n=1 Tax=Capsella rubella TaxID=81985 RepID=R0EV78_9BRAS|nr:hypothetical protein CARUB_v10026018mg [Capsella rubella]
MQRSEELGLYVIDEDDNATLLVHHISTENIYTQQEDSIISWSEPEGSAELALSFQETAGCTYVWNQIFSMKQVLHFNSLNGETFDNVISELKKLPDVSRSNLDLILKNLTEYGSTDQMRVIELILKDGTFFQKLMGVFEVCERNKDVEGLHIMFNIVKEIISLNSSQILDIILGDQLFMRIFGCLEYDPDVPNSQHHRTFLEGVVFKEAIPIKNLLVLSKIHQTYRISYLKDFVLTNVHAAISTHLDTVINANNAAVVTLLKNDIKESFARLQSPSTSDESRNNLVHFLHEFFSLTKSAQQVSVSRELINDGLLDIITEVLKSPDRILVLMGAQILNNLWSQDATLFCSYVVRLETPLLGLLVKGMMEDVDDQTKCQFVEIIKNVLGFGGIQLNCSDKQKKIQGIIFDTFCEKHLPDLVDFIMVSCPERPGDTSEGASVRVGSHCGAKTEVLLHISELLCSCVQLDPSRTNFLHNNVIKKVLLLTRRKEKPLVAAAIRFVRTLLSVHNHNVQSYIVKNNSLKPIIEVFAANGHRNNMLNSAVLQLFEQISKKNVALVKYVVDTFWDQLAPFAYLLPVQNFKTIYENCIESKEPKSTNGQSDMRQDALHEEKSAEPHNSNVTAASSPSRGKRSGGLVDSEDDKSDEDCKRQKLTSTSEGNKNSPEQGDEAMKEPGEL